MKKTKFLALVLVVAVMLMGVGYAAWTDSVKVDTTINAGHLKVTINYGSYGYEVYKDGYAQWTYYTLGEDDLKEYGLTAPTNNVNKKETTLTTNVSNLFPGAGLGQMITVTNDSSSKPVKLNNVTFKFENKGKKNVVEANDILVKITNFNTGKGTQYIPLSETITIKDQIKGQLLGDEIAIDGEQKYYVRYILAKESENSSMDDGGLAITMNLEYIQSNLFGDK